MTIEESHLVEKIKYDFSIAIEKNIFKTLYNSFYFKLSERELNTICNTLKKNSRLIVRKFDNGDIINFYNQNFSTGIDISDIFLRNYFFQFDICFFQLKSWTENFALKNEFLATNFAFESDFHIKSMVDFTIREIYIDNSSFRFNDSSLYINYHNFLYLKSTEKNLTKIRHKRNADIILGNEIERVSRQISHIETSNNYFPFFDTEKKEKLQSSLHNNDYVFKLKTKEINKLSNNFTNLIYNSTTEKKMYVDFNTSLKHLLANNFVFPFDHTPFNKGLMELKTPHKKTFLYFIFLLSELKKCNLDLFIDRLKEHKTILSNIKNRRNSKIKKDFAEFKKGKHPKNKDTIKSIVHTISSQS